MSERSGRPAFVYRAYDDAGQLLYVGCAFGAARLQTHAGAALANGGSSWWEQTKRIEITHYATLAEAREAEALAIYHEHPLHNRANPRVWNLSWQAIEEKRLAGLTWPRVAAELGLSQETVARRVARQRKAGRSRV